jgi:hypothetical protein
LRSLDRRFEALVFDWDATRSLTGLLMAWRCGPLSRRRVRSAWMWRWQAPSMSGTSTATVHGRTSSGLREAARSCCPTTNGYAFDLNHCKDRGICVPSACGRDRNGA